MEEIYFRDVVRFLWKSKWWLAASTVVAVGIGAAMYAKAEPRYEITMTLVPAESGQNPWEQGIQGTTSLASQFLGVSLGDRRIQKVQQFMALLLSPVVLERVEKELGVLRHVYWQSWDPVREQWIEPLGWTTRVRTMLRNDLRFVPPNLADLSKSLERAVIVESTNGGTIVELTFIDRDPAFGVALLQALYRETDAVVRNRARVQNDEHMSYIQKSLSTMSYAETRESLTTLLTAEVGQRVMINSNSPYAMEVLEPAFSNPRPVSPSLTRYMLIAIVVGLLFGIVASGIWSAIWSGLRSQRVEKESREFNKGSAPRRADQQGTSAERKLESLSTG